ncbi:MAG: DUF4440 domain-containing protein [Thiotrichales bacterium]|nr:MAG: DUF4440 domain-containing protein [Thiotrichales bacterium]
MVTADSKANDEKTVANAMWAWRDAFSSTTTEKILALYADDAFLWGTLSSEQRTDPESVSDYFDRAFVYGNRKVVFNDYHIRCYGDTAVSSGSYTFSFEKDGERLTIPARFSLVYVRRDGKWLIVEQHSSVVPEE